jgi:serine/threonine protein kinase/WD40 repeat protein
MGRPSLQQVEKLFHEVAALPPEQRPAYLNAACAGDRELRAAVEELLRHDAAADLTDSFLISPFRRVASKLRSESPTIADGGEEPTAGTKAPFPEIAGYEILGELGRGGMGVVYKARQVSLNRTVALKMLLPGGAATPELLARFRVEADSLARLQLPNIITIYDVGAAEGRPYFTMEYVAGPNLAHVMDGKPQDPARSAELMEVLARTMHAVHERGIIHRDLKPANVLLQDASAEAANATQPAHGYSILRMFASGAVEKWIPKITDFGLAKDQGDTRKLTQSGVSMGTPCYMAPEQAWDRGTGVGPAADQYALGAILYEMLTGRPPFDAATPAETVTQLLNDEPMSPAKLRPRLPLDLATICLKCLEKAPRKRYASTLELAEDLRRFQAGRPLRARPVGMVERAVRWCRRRPLVTALLALTGILAVALVITLLNLRDALAEAQGITEEERKEIVQLDINLGWAELENADAFAALLWFAEALRLDRGPGEQERNHRVRIATTLRQCPRLIEFRSYMTRVLCIQGSADRVWMATVDADHRLQVRDAISGQPAGPAVTLTDSPVEGAISPDGRWLATLAADGTTSLWDLRTGKAQVLHVGRSQAIQRVVFDADSRVLFTQDAHAMIRLWDLTRPLVLPPPLFSQPSTLVVLSDDPRWLFTTDFSQTGQVWEMATGKAVGKPVPLEQDVSQAAISADGGRIALLGADRLLRVWEVVASRWVGSPIGIRQPATHIGFSPDAQRLIISTAGQPAQVRLIETGALLALLSQDDWVITRARWDASGRLVLTTNGAGQVRVWDVATGRALTPPLHHGPLAGATFCGDGGRLVTVSRKGTACVWQLPAGGANRHEAPAGQQSLFAQEATVKGVAPLIKLANGCMVQVARPASASYLSPSRPGDAVTEAAVFSPDGGRVVVSGGDNTARVWSTATGEAVTAPLRHRGAVLYAAFSADGRRLITCSEDRMARVWDADNGEALAPPLAHPRPGRQASFSPDGNRVFVVQERGLVTSWDLSLDERPVDELVRLAQVLARGRINARHQQQALGPAELLASWRSLSPQ